MKSRFKVASFVLLCAMLLSFVPAAVTHTQASAATTCDWAQFVADVTVPDGTSFQAGTAFKKTWRLKNIGSCTWTTSYSMVFVSGTQMGPVNSVSMPATVPPGQTVDVSVDMVAPNSAGNYIGYWKFKNPSGGLFGIGYYASNPWWVAINVSGSTQTGVVYDFGGDQADKAAWSSGAGGLTFPGTDGNANGFALRVTNAKFESGAIAKDPTLLMGPQQITNGYVQGRYSSFAVQSGDRFQATIGCQAAATSCYVTYRLDYEVSGTVRTFWSFREKFEGLTYNANIDLSPLAGQTVNFILYINANGSPIGDRALWATPVIVRKGVTPPPTPTNTPGGPTATPTSTTIPPSSCDRAQFVSDVTVPDGTVMTPGQTFTKTWAIKNLGPCQWTTSYQMVFVSGEQMGAPNSLAFTTNVPAGQTVKFSVNMKAPTNAGSYRGYWMFKNANGVLFGIGAQSNKPWWVDIKVSGGATATPGGPTPTATSTSTGPTPTPVANSAYDFVANACFASWFSGAGGIDCTNPAANPKGYVVKVNNAQLENGNSSNQPGLLTVPQTIANGYIQGIYPPFTVKSGDRFKALIGCQYGAAGCYVAFRLDYQVGTGPIQAFAGPFAEKYEGLNKPVDVNLSTLAGKDVKFILTVLRVGAPPSALAMWVGPYIYRSGAPSYPAPQQYPQQATTPTPTTSSSTGATPTPTTSSGTGTTPTSTPTTSSGTGATPTPTTSSSSSGSTYQNTKYNFKFTLPPGASIVSQTDQLGRVSLPIVTPGTNLQEKYALVTVTDGKNPCEVTDMEGQTAKDNVTINGTQFVKQTGQGVAAGNQYDWIAYSTPSTTQNNACISISFVLHSTNPANYSTPPAVYDQAQESAVVDTVMNTYGPVTP